MRHSPGIRRLPACHANIKKRLVKSPKVYWRDSGVLHSLLNVTDSSGLLGQPWVGASWEGFVIEQILGHLSALGRRHEAFHLCSSDQNEIDLVVEIAGERWAIDVKLTTSPGPGDLQALERTADLVEASRRHLISQTVSPAGDDQRASCNLEWFVRALREGDQ